MLYFTRINAQTKGNQNITLTISELEIKDEYLNFKLELLNNREQAYTIYKPYLKDICSGILKIYLINIQTNKKHEVFPCNEIDDLGAIFINRKNSVYLKKNEGFIKKFHVNINELSPYINKGVYSFYLEFNLQDVYFKTDIKNVLNENLVSRKIEIAYCPK